MEREVVLHDVESVLRALNQAYRDYHQASDESTQCMERQGFYLCWRWLVDRQVQFYQDLQTHEWKLGSPPLREVVLWVLD